MLEWAPDLGGADARLLKYFGAYDSYQPNPLGNAIKEGHHSALGNGHGVLELDGGFLLTWDRHNGEYAVWALSTSPEDGGDAFHLVSHQQGVFAADQIRGHQVLKIGRGRLLAYRYDRDRKVHYRVFGYQTSAKSAPLLTTSGADQTWSAIVKGDVLLTVGPHHILHWHPKDGVARIWPYDVAKAKPLGKADDRTVLPGIVTGHELIAVDTDHLIDWLPAVGYYRVFAYDVAHYDDPAKKRDPFIQSDGVALVEGFWNTVRGEGHRMIALTGGKILHWDSGGHYRIRHFIPKPAITEPVP